MKSLPVSAKVALWSALLAGLTMGSALLVMTLFLKKELFSNIGQRMDRTSKEIFWYLDNHPNGPVEKMSVVTDDMIPPSAANDYIEIIGPKGEVIYRSEALRERTLRGGPLEPHELALKQRPYWVKISLPYWVETFHHKRFTLFLAYPLKSTYATLDYVRTASLLAMAVVILLSLLGGFWVANRALKPVRAITEVAKHISAEDLRQRLPVPAARDELRLLTKVLNATFDRLERSYLQAMRFASDASHQLKTPVTVMRAAIEALLRDPNLRSDQAATLTDLLNQTRRLSSLSDGLLLLAKADAGRIETDLSDHDLIPIIESCVEDAEILAAREKVRIVRELPRELHAIADPHRTEQVLLNLLENAVKYNRNGGTIRVRAASRRDGVFITIANTGTPIAPDRVPWIFDRFARGDRFESRAGHGLGLSIARELATAQGGVVRLVRSENEWTEFELRLRHPTSRKSKGDTDPFLTPPPRPRFPEITVDS